MDRIREKVSDGKTLNLIELFLKQEIMEGMKCWNPISGTPQGAVLSPLLSNVYLHQLDLTLYQNGFKMIRYADFVERGLFTMYEAYVMARQSR